MACLRSTHASRIAGPNFSLYRFTRSLSRATGPSLGGGGGLGGVAATGGFATGAAGGAAGLAAGSAGGLGKGVPSAAGGFAADGSFGELAEGCFSSGSFAMNWSRAGCAQTAQPI